MAQSLSVSWRAAAAGLIGLALGVSAFFDGFYSVTQWAPIALLVLALLLALAIATPALPRGPAAVATASLIALAVWSLISTRWAESADQALIDADRLILYAAVLCVLLLVLRGRELGVPLLAGIVGGIGVLAAYLLVVLAAGDGPGLFLANRLNEPLNYVNGMGAYLLVAFWPLVAAAERSRSAIAAGAAMAGAVAIVGLTLLTLSRGALLALVGSAVLLVAFAPGRLTRGWALVAVGLGVGISLLGLRDALAALPAGVDVPAEDDLRAAALGIVAGALVAGAAWGAARGLIAGSEDEPASEGRRRTSAIALCAVAAVGLIAVSVPPGERIDQVSEQLDAFTELETVSSVDRLTSGGGNRYDYWRVAWEQFKDDPLQGTGAGNYDRTYFVERRTSEDVRQAHSIELQTLGETGLIGGLALFGFLGATLFALWRGSRVEDTTLAGRGLAVAAGGTFLIWLLQTSIDWIHLIPGATFIALAASAVLLEPWMREVPASASRQRLALAAGAGVAAAVSAVLIAIPWLTERSVEDAREELGSDPEAALASSRDALAVNDESVDAYILEAAALARLGDYRGSKASLLEATEREPHDFVPWALLGDLETRRGETAQARAAYERALELNPRDESLRSLTEAP